MQLSKDKKRAQEVENMRSNVDMAKHLDTVKFELVSERRDIICPLYVVLLYSARI